jgi:hypothetical protein
MAKKSSLKTGHRHEFICLQIDIAGHSKIAAADRALHAAKERFHDRIKALVEGYGALTFKWEGDGGAFLFPVTDGSEFSESVFAAFGILDSLPRINDEIRQTAGLSQTLSVRISVDTGLAVYNRNPGLITGDFLNAFLKNERAISLVNEVTISERIYKQLSEELRKRFAQYKESGELGCWIYQSSGQTAKSPARADAADVAAQAGAPAVPMDRASLVRFLMKLNPTDMAKLVSLIKGAELQVSRHGTVPEQAGELIRWVESSTGPGLATLQRVVTENFR